MVLLLQAAMVRVAAAPSAASTAILCLAIR
jgi:hypothetical protein